MELYRWNRYWRPQKGGEDNSNSQKHKLDHLESVEVVKSVIETVLILIVKNPQPGQAGLATAAKADRETAQPNQTPSKTSDKQ